MTGAHSALGAATARQPAAEGAKVVLAARRRDKGEKVLREIEAAGGTGLFVPTDVNSTADIKALVAAASERFGGLDGAFNNAGVTCPTRAPLADVDKANIGIHGCRQCFHRAAGGHVEEDGPAVAY